MNKQLLNSAQRSSNLPIHSVFLERWSPRAYTGVPIKEHHLLTLLEAARWAPSAYNIQPWRFIYCLNSDSQWPLFIDLLDPFNASWARQAGALIILLSDTLIPGEPPERASTSHSFDAGTAWAHIALQAHFLGYRAHALGGISRNKIRRLLSVPDRYKIEIGITVGVQANKNILPKDLQDRELPSQRLPLNHLLMPNTIKPQGDQYERK